ncbi:hypothetical protein CXF85_19850 [Colwellia sp. 75C3]|uniref:hypothetical protein n=1 Tax=Colwellia sp. 75C3 TaxID=888425 RepID=UPI000C3316F3|nr:hypothetical protein [Colwellia sp. 75C3]PKG81019.1 hypothetical protein CXF85_19850 [Colwellia sp. 75C3]
MISSKEVVKEYNKGLSIEEIAAQYHLNPDSVHMALQVHGCTVAPTEAEQAIANARDSRTSTTTQRAIAWMNHKGYDQDTTTLILLAQVIELLNSKANYRDVMALGIEGMKSIKQVADFKKALSLFEDVSV